MRICTFQVPMSDKVGENADTVFRCLSTAVDAEADLAVFPEMMLVGYDLHLHDLFKDPTWYDQVLNGLETIREEVSDQGVSALVGTPFQVEHGYHNAMVLIDPSGGVREVGARKILVEGWNELGFLAPDRKDPTSILGILCGFIICNEVSNLDELVGSGIENSELIFWPGVIRNHLESGRVTKDGCVEGARSIAEHFHKPVIQSSHFSQTSPLESNRKLGGTVIADSDGSILQQASYDHEAHLLYDWASSLRSVTKYLRASKTLISPQTIYLPIAILVISEGCY